MPAPANIAMNWETMAAMGSAAIALISAIVSFVFARKSQSAQSGALELDIRASIRGTKTRVSDLTLAHLETMQKGVSDPKFETVKTAIVHAVEENLNAYDEACAKYLDGKIDKIRFKKMYQTEIRQLVEDPNHSAYVNSLSTKYNALVSVFNEWEKNPRSG